MKSCAYCGRENGDTATRCSECGTSDFVSPHPWSEPIAVAPPAGLGRRRKCIRLALLFIAVFCAALVLSKVQCQSTAGVHVARLPPFVGVTVAPTRNWIVQTGIIYRPDSGTGMAGYYVEFPIWPGYRGGIRFFSPRWWREEQAK